MSGFKCFGLHGTHRRPIDNVPFGGTAPTKRIKTYGTTRRIYKYSENETKWRQEQTETGRRKAGVSQLR
jgi:hypothetical protein